MRRLKTAGGFTLIEVVVVIVITGILLTVAVGTGQKITDSARTEQTLQELDQLALAIVGDPGSYSNGTRSEFGYVGDVGSLPPNLEALISNPGSYSTWNGPYTNNRFEQTATDYKKDAWQTDYQYTGGPSITSTGSGETIVRQLASSTNHLLYNNLSGNLYDSDGQPPGSVYKDSIRATVFFPDGSGGMKSVSATPDLGGYFTIDSVPIGNHDLMVVYLPTNDTLKRFITVLPNSNVYEECRLPFSTWTSAGGGLEYVPGSAVVTGSGPHCDEIQFDMINNSPAPVDITSVILSWTSPVSYYKQCKIGGTQVFNSQSPRNGSGDTVSFASIVINAGATITFSFELFNDSPTSGGGNNKTNMENTSFTVSLSDGSSISFSTGVCP